MTTCAKCGLDCTGHEAEKFRLCDNCLSEARRDADRQWSDLIAARRANGIDPVHHSEMTEDYWRDEVTPAVETMQDQERYERGTV